MKKLFISFFIFLSVPTVTGAEFSAPAFLATLLKKIHGLAQAFAYVDELGTPCVRDITRQSKAPVSIPSKKQSAKSEGNDRDGGEPESVEMAHKTGALFYQ